MSDAPTFSVIVVCKNPGARLHAALSSVWTQRDAAVELIVIDGASRDGTGEWLTSQRARIATLVSEPDSGIYAAMNKGIASARGDWVYFLGADDRLDGETVLSKTAAWTQKTAAGVIAGEAIFEDGRIYRVQAGANPIARNFVHHQAAFYRRELFIGHGQLDTTLAVMADYDFNLRLWRSHVPLESIPLRIARCGVGGVSDGGTWRGYREEIAVRHRYFPAWRCWFWDILSGVRFARKKVARSFAKH